MAANRIICTTNNIDYVTIRKAMIAGARTEAEIAETAGVCLECEGCKKNLGKILSTACGCKNVSMETVITAVRNGANTVDKVGEVTGAGTGIDKETGEPCGRCKPLIQNIIDLGR